MNKAPVHKYSVFFWSDFNSYEAIKNPIEMKVAISVFDL